MNLEIGTRVIASCDNAAWEGVITNQRTGMFPWEVRTDDGQTTWFAASELTPIPEPAYDSTDDTTAHINVVRVNINHIISNLAVRGIHHDQSKLHPPEKLLFDEYTPKLRGLTYGSDEYKASLAAMGPALEHHYAHNNHHPQFYPDGVADMTLLDLLEMLADWKAASQRHTDGSLTDSFRVNEARFAIAPGLLRMLRRTAVELGWLDRDDEPQEPTP